MTLAVVIFVLLGIAAWRDITTRTIPDVVSLGILLVGVAARLLDGPAAVATSAAAAVVLFFVLLPFHSRGLVGGGDLKLLAALAFGLSPLTSYQMVVDVVLAGGVLALVYVALRRILIHFGADRISSPPRRYIAGRFTARFIARRIIVVELWRIRKGAPLPYGIAIAAGASLVIGHQGA